MFYLDNRTKYKFTQYDGHRPDPQVMDDKKMLHLAKSSTVSVRFQPEILNGNLSILYVVSPFTIIINLSQLSSIIHNYHQFIHPQLSSRVVKILEHFPRARPHTISFPKGLFTSPPNCISRKTQNTAGNLRSITVCTLGYRDIMTNCIRFNIL